MCMLSCECHRLILEIYFCQLLFRPDGRESCSIEWKSSNIFTDGDVLTEQTAFTFYSLVFGFLGPLVFIFIFYLLVLIRFSTLLTTAHLYQNNTGKGDIFNVLIINIGIYDPHYHQCRLVVVTM